MPQLRISAWPEAFWPVETILEVAHEVEQAGYEGIWLSDHFMTNTGTEEPAESGQHECFALLAALATQVPRVRLGSMVAGMTYRHPAVLANAASTIDHLSGGRFVLGIGAGWQVNEHVAYGIRLGSIRERIDRFEEGAQVIKGLLTNRRTTMAGSHYTVTEAPLNPKPLQPSLPLLLGASGEQRTLGIVAALADQWNCWSDPDVYARKSAALDEHCERLGRDPKSIWRTTQAILRFDEPPVPNSRPVMIGGSVDQIVDVVGRWQDAGLDEWIVPGWGLPDQGREIFHRVMTEVVPQLS